MKLYRVNVIWDDISGSLVFGVRRWLLYCRGFIYTERLLLFDMPAFGEYTNLGLDLERPTSILMIILRTYNDTKILLHIDLLIVITLGIIPQD
jgi:hypothetical protein